MTQSASSFVFQFPPPPTGVVAVAWAPDHGITDLAVATNAFQGGGWTYVVDPAVPLPRLIISEFMAANNLTLRDEDGAYSDWIEIKNTSPSAVNLGGWYLTDDAHDLTQWRFPSTNLPPNGYLVVFASGKNRAIGGRPLHTGFQLDSAGEYLALVRPDGVTIAHEFAPAYPAQPGCGRHFES